VAFAPRTTPPGSTESTPSRIASRVALSSARATVSASRARSRSNPWPRYWAKIRARSWSNSLNWTPRRFSATKIPRNAPTPSEHRSHGPTILRSLRRAGSGPMLAGGEEGAASRSTRSTRTDAAASAPTESRRSSPAVASSRLRVRLRSTLAAPSRSRRSVPTRRISKNLGSKESCSAPRILWIAPACVDGSRWRSTWSSAASTDPRREAAACSSSPTRSSASEVSAWSPLAPWVLHPPCRTQDT
jgi:hypothetical protein